MSDYVGTYWRSTDVHRRYNIYAVVYQHGNCLRAWELEIRENNLYHPAYGIIPRSNIDEIDVFVKSAGNKYPSFSFEATERGFYYAGDNIQNIIWIPMNT